LPDGLRLGDVVSEPALHHPFYLHGYFFQILEHHKAGTMAHFVAERTMVTERVRAHDVPEQSLCSRPHASPQVT
jgi:hypothetical protein